MGKANCRTKERKGKGKYRRNRRNLFPVVVSSSDEEATDDV